MDIGVRFRLKRTKFATCLRMDNVDLYKQLYGNLTLGQMKSYICPYKKYGRRRINHNCKKSAVVKVETVKNIIKRINKIVPISKYNGGKILKYLFETESINANDVMQIMTVCSTKRRNQLEMMVLDNWLKIGHNSTTKMKEELLVYSFKLKLYKLGMLLHHLDIRNNKIIKNLSNYPSDISRELLSEYNVTIDSVMDSTEYFNNLTSYVFEKKLFRVNNISSGNLTKIFEKSVKSLTCKQFIILNNLGLIHNDNLLDAIISNCNVQLLPYVNLNKCCVTAKMIDKLFKVGEIESELKKLKPSQGGRRRRYNNMIQCKVLKSINICKFAHDPIFLSKIKEFFSKNISYSELKSKNISLNTLHDISYTMNSKYCKMLINFMFYNECYDLCKLFMTYFDIELDMSTKYYKINYEYDSEEENEFINLNDISNDKFEEMVNNKEIENGWEVKNMRVKVLNAKRHINELIVNDSVQKLEYIFKIGLIKLTDIINNDHLLTHAITQNSINMVNYLYNVLNLKCTNNILDKVYFSDSRIDFYNVKNKKDMIKHLIMIHYPINNKFISKLLDMNFIECIDYISKNCNLVFSKENVKRALVSGKILLKQIKNDKIKILSVELIDQIIEHYYTKARELSVVNLYGKAREKVQKKEELWLMKYIIIIKNKFNATATSKSIDTLLRYKKYDQVQSICKLFNIKYTKTKLINAFKKHDNDMGWSCSCKMELNFIKYMMKTFNVTYSHVKDVTCIARCIGKLILTAKNLDKLCNDLGIKPDEKIISLLFHGKNKLNTIKLLIEKYKINISRDMYLNAYLLNSSASTYFEEKFGYNFTVDDLNNYLTNNPNKLMRDKLKLINKFGCDKTNTNTSHIIISNIYENQRGVYGHFGYRWPKSYYTKTILPFNKIANADHNNGINLNHYKLKKNIEII